MEQCPRKKADSINVIPSGLSLNDAWSLYLTHWLTDKVVNILAFSMYIYIPLQVITTLLQIKCSNVSLCNVNTGKAFTCLGYLIQSKPALKKLCCPQNAVVKTQ